MPLSRYFHTDFAAINVGSETANTATFAEPGAETLPDVSTARTSYVYACVGAQAAVGPRRARREGDVGAVAAHEVAGDRRGRRSTASSSRFTDVAVRPLGETAGALGAVASVGAKAMQLEVERAVAVVRLGLVHLDRDRLVPDVSRLAGMSYS